MEGEGSGKKHPAWNEVREDHNPWCEFFIAEMVLRESTHTVLPEAQRVFKLACRYKEWAEESSRSDSSRKAYTKG